MDSLYLATIAKIKGFYLGETPGFNENLPIFTRLNYVVIFESLSVYPDVFGVVANASPPSGTSAEFTEAVLNLTKKIYADTKPLLKKRFDKEYQSFLSDMGTLQLAENMTTLWRSAISDEEREKYNWVNFLIWCNRKY